MIFVSYIFFIPQHKNIHRLLYNNLLVIQYECSLRVVSAAADHTAGGSTQAAEGRPVLRHTMCCHRQSTTAQHYMDPRQRGVSVHSPISGEEPFIT